MSLPGLMLRGGGGGGLEDWEESSLSEGPVLETSDADEGDMSGESRRGSGQEEEWEEELREEDEDLRKVLRKQRTKAVRDGEMFWSQPVPQGLEMEEVSVLVYACADGHFQARCLIRLPCAVHSRMDGRSARARGGE